MEFVHKSILLDEVIENLNIREDGCYVDGTLGGAGHSYQICTHLGEKGRLIGIDQDADAIQAATKRLEPYKDKVSIVRSNYVNFDNVLDELGIDKVNGILLDLGVSSYQLDEASRGFTYREDVPLDMRMDQRQKMIEADIAAAQTSKTEAAAALTTAQDKLRNVDNEAAARREAYEKQAEVEKQQLLADAQKQADEIVAAGKAAVEIERQNKLREADAQATALARSMCEKLLKHNLTAQDDDQLLDDLLQKAGAGNGN